MADGFLLVSESWSARRADREGEHNGVSAAKGKEEFESLLGLKRKGNKQRQARKTTRGGM